MITPSTTGAITPVLLHIRQQLEAILQPLGWKLLTADTPFQKFNALYNSGSGSCVISWKSDDTIEQAGQSLVIRARIAITLAASLDAINPATSRIEKTRLFEINDRVKGAMLAIEMPSATCPQPGSETALYQGSSPLVAPDGTPMDAIEQSWEVELIEAFSPEYTPPEEPESEE